MKIKSLMIAGFALLFVASSFAQAPSAQGSLPAPVELLTAVQTALGLSAAQVEAARTLLQNQNTDSQPLLADIRAKQEGLRTLQRSGTASASDLGNALAALQTAEAKLKALHAKFVSDFENLLTSDQKQIVANTRAAAERIPALARIGLIEGGPGGFIGGPGGRGGPGPGVFGGPRQ